MNNSLTTNTINIYYQNLSGAKSKVNFINNKLATSSFDLVCFVETWFDSSVLDRELYGGNNYSLQRADRSKFKNNRSRGGGICIFCAEHFTSIGIETHTYRLITLQVSRKLKLNG